MSQWMQQLQMRQYRNGPSPGPARTIHIRSGDWRDRLSDKKQAARNTPPNPINPINQWACQPRNTA